MEIKDFRYELSRFMNATRHLESSREVSLCFTYLQRSFAWLGEALKESGSPTPYPESENPKSPVIEPQADRSDDSLLESFSVFGDNQVAKVKFFRSIIEHTIQELKAFRYELAMNSAVGERDLCILESYRSLKDAKIALGWELARIGAMTEA